MYLDSSFPQSEKDALIRQQLIMETAENLRNSGFVRCDSKLYKFEQMDKERSCGIISPFFNDMDFY